MRNIHIFMSIAIMTVLVASVSARAQGFGEQAPLQFKYVNQGMQTEIYRQQFKASAASAAAQALGGREFGLGWNRSGRHIHERRCATRDDLPECVQYRQWSHVEYQWSERGSAIVGNESKQFEQPFRSPESMKSNDGLV